MQRKKNIRLLIILTILIVITAFVFIYQPNSDNLEKVRFTLSNIEEVDRVEIVNNSGEMVLALEGRQWKLNNKYTANIARINDLFVILEKVNTRRKVSKEEQLKLESLFETNGATVNFFSSDARIKQLKVVENEKGTLSYFIDNDGTGYICNISGHNYHIAQLFNLDVKGWRSNYVFTSNWTTLEKLEVNYFDREGFEIRYDPAGYYIENVNELDTAKLYSYLKQISFLQVNKYLETTPNITEQPTVTINVNDAGDKSIHLSFYEEGEMYYGWIDSIEWATFYPQDVVKLMRTKNWFEKID